MNAPKFPVEVRRWLEQRHQLLQHERQFWAVLRRLLEARDEEEPQHRGTGGGEGQGLALRHLPRH